MRKIVMSAGLMLLSAQANAAVFTVNVLTDGVDANHGDGICEITVGAGDCSLRAAINEANDLGGMHEVLLGSGIHALSVTGDDDLGYVGDLDVIGTQLTLTGAGSDQTLIDGLGLHGIFDLDGVSTFSLSGMTLTRGLAATAIDTRGGALSANWGLIEVHDVKFTDNAANAGGAIFVQDGDLLVSNSYFVGNEARDLGFTNTFGAVIAVDRGSLDITGSTFFANDVGTFSIEVKSGQLNMTNATLYDNQAGGVRVSNSPAVIRASTLQNQGGSNLSRYSFDDSHLLEVGGSVISAERGATWNCAPGDKPTSLGYNVVSDNSCLMAGTGDQINVPAGLHGLLDHGGSWPTLGFHLLAPGLDLVPLSDCLDDTGATLLTDQRGTARPSGTGCDAGAYEFDYSELIFNSGFGD